MIEVTPHARGAVLPVRARPGARRNAVLDEHAGSLRVSVTAPPEDGKANDAIVRVLADTFGRSRSTIHLIAGQTSRTKKFLFESITADELAALLPAVLKSPSSENGPTPDA
jgi:uncharacterized protein (TIGR00251 family)